MKGLLSKDTARHCECRRPRTAAAGVRAAHAPSERAQRVALTVDALRTGLSAVSLREVNQLAADLAVMDAESLCRGCGWPLLGARRAGSPRSGSWTA